jgi:hypothetical protein
LLCGILFLTGWALIALSGSVAVLFAGRVLTVTCAGVVAISIG